MGIDSCSKAVAVYDYVCSMSDLAHDHPSSDPVPGPDNALTKGIAKAGELFDPVVMGNVVRFTSGHALGLRLGFDPSETLAHCLYVGREVLDNPKSRVTKKICTQHVETQRSIPAWV